MPTPDDGEAGRLLSRLGAGEGEISITALNGEPPKEVLDQIAAAAELHAEMLEDGREVRFLENAEGKHLRIELRDRSGGLIRTLTVAEAMELVSGSSED